MLYGVETKHINQALKNNPEKFPAGYVFELDKFETKQLIERDVAWLYGVETKHVNQALKNNPEKFPAGYVIELDKHEKYELVKNFDRFNVLKHSAVMPTAFTEKGLYMLATIMKSPQAVMTTLSIIETFTMTRQLSRTMESLQTAEDGGEQQKGLLQKTGEILADIVGRNLSTSNTETEIEITRDKE